MIGIEVMPYGFFFHGIPPFVGVNSVVCDIIDIRFIKSEQICRQGENGHAVDLLVGVKSPSKRMGTEQGDCYQEKRLNGFHHHFWV
jgi:hypothetical protein